MVFWCGLKLARTSALSVVRHSTAELRERLEVWEYPGRVCLAGRRQVTTTLEGRGGAAESLYRGPGG